MVKFSHRYDMMHHDVLSFFNYFDTRRLHYSKNKKYVRQVVSSYKTRNNQINHLDVKLLSSVDNASISTRFK